MTETRKTAETFAGSRGAMGRLDYRTLRENVADEIRMKIINGELLPGARIVEQDLASEFGVSRGPVREALRQLEEEGLVEYTRNAGCSVRQIGPEDIYEIYYMRANYEIMAVKLYGKEFPAQTLEQMQKITDQMKTLQDDAYREVFELDNQFHEQIMDLVPFKRLKKAWDDLSYGNIIIGYNMNVKRDDVVQIQYQIHEKLLNVCQGGNLEEIVQAILNHYLFGLEKLIRKMKEEAAQETVPDTQESA